MLVPTHFQRFSKSKGTFRSLPVIIGVLMIPLFFAAVIGYKALTVIEDLGLAVGFSVNLIDTLKTQLMVFDSIILLVFGVSFGAVIIRSFRINTPLVFAVVGLFVLPITVFAAAYASNAVGVFTNLGYLSSAANQFPLATIFFQNTGLIAAGSGVLVLLVMVGGALIRQ